MARHVSAVVAEIGHAAGGGADIAADDLEQGRFAGAVGADQAHHLAFPHRKADVPQGDHAPEIARHALDLERERTHRPLPFSVLRSKVPTTPLGAYITTASNIRP